eukprot:s42_g1.t1
MEQSFRDDAESLCYAAWQLSFWNLILDQSAGSFLRPRRKGSRVPPHGVPSTGQGGREPLAAARERQSSCAEESIDIFCKDLVVLYRDPLKRSSREMFHRERERAGTEILAEDWPENREEGSDRNCRDLNELCQEAAAVEVATLLLGGQQSEAPAFQRAHAVANLLLSGGAAPRAAAASPPYLQRLWMLRRARRRVRAIRQVKQVLSLRDELLLRSAYSCWCNRSQLRRLVLCGRAISEASAAKREATRCCNDRSSRCMLASQVLMHWGLATARAIRGRPCDSSGLAATGAELRRRRFDGLAAVVRRGEAACRLVLLYASLHAWSDCRRKPSPSRPVSGLHGIQAAGAETVKARTSMRRSRAVLLSWAHLTLRRRAQMQGERLAQESAELLRLQLRYLQLRHREAETFHSHRLVEGSFNLWLRVVEVNHEHRALRLYAKLVQPWHVPHRGSAPALQLGDGCGRLEYRSYQ